MQSNFASSAAILAGLVLERTAIKQILRSQTMRESVVYQDILREGKEQGIEQGRQEGKAALVLRQLNRRLGSALAEIEARIQQLSLAQIEALGEALLDFETAGDLERWLGST